MIELQQISKRYDAQMVLAPLDLTLRQGATTVLIGPSGCGKSTLLRIVLGLIQPDQGEVRIHGERVGSANVNAVRHRTGYVIQDGGLFPHLTARGNIVLLARHLGWDAPRIEARVAVLCKLTRIEPAMLDRYPRELSGGQRQRVSLMRALMLDPPVLLLDEPLTGLDPMVRSELQQQLKAIFSELRKTVVMVTHDMHEAALLADEIVLMRAGHVVQRGSAQDLLRRPVDGFVTEFIRAQRGFLE